MCSLLFPLRIHHPDCEHCHVRETYGDETRKRLEELNWRTRPYSLNNVGRGEVVRVVDSKPSEVINLPIFVGGQGAGEARLEPGAVLTDNH
jgi:hypothetical protein